MEVRVKRIYKCDKYTIGKLYINNEYFSDTLEDKVRILNSYEDKVYGETAIPIGRYKVILSYSPHFKRVLPEILNVQFFSDIRIHNGSYPENTKGCILVGENKKKGMLVNSKATLDKLMKILEGEEEIYLSIE